MSATVSWSLWVGCLVVFRAVSCGQCPAGIKATEERNAEWSAMRLDGLCNGSVLTTLFSCGNGEKTVFFITHTDNTELRKSCLFLTCCGVVSWVPNERELYWRILPSWIIKHEAKQQPQNQGAQQDLMVSQFPWKENGAKSGQKENLTRVGRYTGNPFIYNLLCLETGLWRRTYFLQECVEWG